MRIDSCRKVFPTSEHELGSRGTRARLRERVDMVKLLSAQSALGDITTSLVSNVRA